MKITFNNGYWEVHDGDARRYYRAECLADDLQIARRRRAHIDQQIADLQLLIEHANNQRSKRG